MASTHLFVALSKSKYAGIRYICGSNGTWTEKRPARALRVLVSVAQNTIVDLMVELIVIHHNKLHRRW